MNRFQITAEIATTVWLGTAENYKYKPNRVHFRDIYTKSTTPKFMQQAMKNLKND